MNTFVYIVGWLAIIYGFCRLVVYVRRGKQELDQMSNDWHREHEYREGKRG